MKIPDEELIEDLKRIGELLRKTPTQGEYSIHGKYSTTTFTNRRPWNKWLIEMFGEINRKINWRNGKKISKKGLMENLLDIYKKIGSVPQKEDLKHGKYGPSGYNRVFGNLANALLAVGLKPHQRRGLTDEELISDLQRVYELLGHTPSIEEFTKYTQTVSWVIVYDRFGSWTKALLAANIPIEKAGKVSKQDVINALNIWYEQNNKDTSCLEYWIIRKAKARREFPYSCETVSYKFNKIPWENIMKTIDSNYKTTNQFVKRGFFPGKDGNTYLSSIERHSANLLYLMKNNNKIKDYEYEAKVCDERNWTCDFKITLNNGDFLWLEIDGMRNNRSNPYASGENEKIKYYRKNNYNFGIISYYDKFEDKLIELIERSDNGQTKKV